MSTVTTIPASLPKVGLLEAVNNWTLLAIAAVAVAEATKNAESTGTSKLQTAMDIIKAEAALTMQVDPVLGALADTLLKPIVNGIVLVNNLRGLFGHKPKAAGATA